ncbi:MAG: sulfate transporter [Burkholderiales bacterium]|nr:sulfate transporter [Burkholderiales bacterium]
MPIAPERVAPSPAAERALRFDRMEWAGAFGDLGTLVPFLIAYVTVGAVPATGMLCAFGIALIATGIVYRTPIPVQPMKAAGAVVATQAAALALTPEAVFAATLVTGAIWLVLGLSGAAQRVAALLSPSVIAGVVVGLGVAFMLDGLAMIASGWVLGTVTLAATLALLAQRKVPAMLVVLAAGAAVALVQRPELAGDLRALEPVLELPAFVVGAITLQDLVLGALFVALPQVPLTLGNAVVAVTGESNRVFPDRPVSERRIALSTGVINLAGGLIGGVPMCHGAGGLAAHVRFGARTGGATVIIGAVLLALGTGLGGSIQVVLQLFPTPMLGAVLFLAGAQLASGPRVWGRARGERLVMLATAAVAVWNAGAACVFGVVAIWVLRRASRPR